jgi:hypothetical protein
MNNPFQDQENEVLQLSEMRTLRFALVGIALLGVAAIVVGIAISVMLR